MRSRVRSSARPRRTTSVERRSTTTAAAMPAVMTIGNFHSSESEGRRWSRTSEGVAADIAEEAIGGPAADKRTRLGTHGAIAALFRRTRRFLKSDASEVERRAEESDVRKRLRKGAGLPAQQEIIPFGKQPDVVTERQEALEQSNGVGAATQKDVIVGQPEAAREKRGFPLGQTVVSLGAVVAKHETVDDQALLHKLDGAANAWIARRQEADERNEQHAGVGKLRPVRLNEGVHTGVEGFRTNVGVDLVAHLAPVVDRSVEAEHLGALDRAVERDPGHDLGMREVLWRSPYLHDALVGVFPDLFEPLGEGLLE